MEATRIIAALACRLGLHAWEYAFRPAVPGDFRNKPGAAPGDVYGYRRCRHCELPEKQLEQRRVAV